MLLSVLILIGFIYGINAHGCRDDGDGRFNKRLANYDEHHRLKTRSQEGTTLPPETNEFRSLEWGDLNFVHITDTHGWLSGHLANQAQYSADWGDLLSFTEHLQAEADRRNVDFLIIETGDRHDGTGLSDSTAVDGSRSQEILAQMNLDVLSLGNHELYKSDAAQQEYDMLRPYYGERYLSSNVDIWDEVHGEWVPSGGRYRLFETKNRKYRILAFGFLYDFTGNANNTRVTRVEEAVKQDWFQTVIRRNDFDIILLTGHLPVRDFKEIDAVVHEIRRANPTVPIQGFGGHTHVRDFRKFDDNAVALESGRYLETVGWASVKFGVNSTKFTRRYIDFNPSNFAYHTNTTLNATANNTLLPFQTEKGLAVSQMIAETRNNLTLNHEFAYVDRDYLTEWTAFNSSNSIFRLASNKVLPLLKGNVSRDTKPRYIVCNTGNFRYMLFKGPFTEDSKYIVSPYTNEWLYAEDVPLDIASKVIDHLNHDYKYIKRSEPEDSLLSLIESSKTTSIEIPTPAPATSIYIPTPDTNATANFRRYVGYLTHDDYGSSGDDVPHIPYKSHSIPNAFQTVQNVEHNTSTADVIFVSFLQNDIASFLSDNGWKGDIKLYGGKYSRDLLEEYFMNQKRN